MSYLAIDIGASSGRHIVENGGEYTEVYRFKTGFSQVGDSLVCDVERLVGEVIRGIGIALGSFDDIASLSIDTWGVDYALIEDEKTLFPVYAYRDGRTAEVIDELHSAIPFEELYRRTGIQFQPFNSIYQLYADKKAGRLENATDFLMLPEYINYRLTGVKMKEYTNATTTGLVNAQTKSFDLGLIGSLGLPERLFPELHTAGEKVGDLLPGIQSAVGGNIPVVLCLSHDTASAVYGIPFEKHAPYISSGTWSLLGITQEKAHTDRKSMSANYSNEGGIDRTFRYQKNIVGMWAVNQACADLGISDAIEFEKLASKSGFTGIADLNDPMFMTPGGFVRKLENKLRENGGEIPQTAEDTAACVLRSLAWLYKEALDELETNIGESYDELYIVGGGAKNRLLNRFTEEYTGKKITALPIEATAIGNIRIQKETDR